MESQRRSALILRFSPGAAIRPPFCSFSSAEGRPKGRPLKSIHRPQHIPYVIYDLVDLALGDDEWGRKGDDIARRAHQEAIFEGLQECGKGALRRLAGDRLQF